MAKPDFSKKNFFFKIFPLVPQGRFFSGKDTFGGPKEIFWKIFFFWKNLVWPFWPVRNANRKNGLAFYSTPWEPKKRLMPASISEKVVPLFEFNKYQDYQVKPYFVGFDDFVSFTLESLYRQNSNFWHGDFNAKFKNILIKMLTSNFF